MENDIQSFLTSVLLGEEIYTKTMLSLFILCCAFVVRWMVSRLISRQISNDVSRHYYWQQGSKYVIYIACSVLVARVWFEGVGSLATFLGLVAAGLAIAMSDVIASLVGFAYVVWMRPFSVGDRIQIGDMAGDVIDVRLLQFLVMEINAGGINANQSSGRILHIPNNKLLKEALVNFETGFRYVWSEIQVQVTFESSWEKAKELLNQILLEEAETISPEGAQEFRNASRHYMLVVGKLTPIVYLSVADSGIVFTMRYLSSPRKVRGSCDRIWTRILKEFEKCEDIDLAYPTNRVFFNPTEGKSEARAPLSASVGKSIVNS